MISVSCDISDRVINIVTMSLRAKSLKILKFLKMNLKIISESVNIRNDRMTIPIDKTGYQFKKRSKSNRIEFISEQLRTE